MSARETLDFVAPPEGGRPRRTPSLVARRLSSREIRSRAAMNTCRYRPDAGPQVRTPSAVGAKGDMRYRATPAPRMPLTRGAQIESRNKNRKDSSCCRDGESITWTAHPLSYSDLARSR